MRRPRALIIAGPNGAGKTTFAREFLVGEWACETFINADLIAAGLAPFKPEDASLRAMRLMAQLMHSCAEARKDFAVESTLSGRTYVTLIREWKRRGYLIKIVYLKVSSVKLAIGRVRARVAQGGHGVPEAVIRRRFVQGWDNFQRVYRSLADMWQIYDADGPKPIMIDEGENK
jgi:predicted ABC-type ATPase